MQRTEQLERLARTFTAALDLLDEQYREPDRWEEECLTYALGAMACGLYPAAEVELAAFARPVAERTPEELAEVETAAEGAGKNLAEWLRELALKAARERPADPTELVLAEVSALRYMLLNLFHATAQANAEGKHLLPDSVVKIRDQANARKLADARKLLAEFLSQEGPDGGKQ